VPVIASSVGGIPEFVKDEENGLLIEPGDTEGLLNQLNRILDAQLYLKLKEAVKQQRTEFSADKQAQRIKDVIDFCFKGSE
jgi:glycosyltransferase involved in cell wall biosynthesis